MRLTPSTKRAVLLGAITALAATPVLGHEAGSAAPELPGVLLTLVPEPLPWLGAFVGAVGYLALVRRVNAAHLVSPVPRWRVVAWLAGIVTVLVALVSAVDVYADELLTVHMVQHLLLTMVAPPLLALGAPVTLVMRAARPVTRRRLLLPVLHSRLVRVAASPLLAWPVFTAVMWFAHFSPLYEAALENPAIHVVEHVVFLAAGAALLVAGRGRRSDPAPHGPRRAVRVPRAPDAGQRGGGAGDLLGADSSSTRTTRPRARAGVRRHSSTSRSAALVMWAAGDLLLLAAVVAIVAAWMQADARRTRRADGRRAALAAVEAPTPPDR